MYIYIYICVIPIYAHMIPFNPCKCGKQGLLPSKLFIGFLDRHNLLNMDHTKSSLRDYILYRGYMIWGFYGDSRGNIRECIMEIL